MTRLRCVLAFVAGYVCAVTVAYTLDEIFGVSNHQQKGPQSCGVK